MPRADPLSLRMGHQQKKQMKVGIKKGPSALVVGGEAEWNHFCLKVSGCPPKSPILGQRCGSVVMQLACGDGGGRVDLSLIWGLVQLFQHC